MAVALRSRKSNIKQLWHIGIYYILTFGYYRSFWLYKNWSTFYLDNGVIFNSKIRSILSIIPAFYMYYVWGQINFIGDICTKNGISTFPYRRTIGTAFIFILLIIFAIKTLLWQPFLLLYFIVDLSMILFVQFNLNKYWLIEILNIDILAHTCASEILRENKKHINYKITAISILISWITIYVFYKERINNTEEIDSKAKASFSLLLQAPDIRDSAGIQRNYNEYNDCKIILMNVWHNIHKLNNSDSHEIKSIVNLCKLLLKDDCREKAWNELRNIINDESKINSLMKVFDKFGKLTFIAGH